MNKLKTDINAGIGFEWDDFRFEQLAVREAFYGILSAFGITPAQSFIISGCEVTGVAPTQFYNPGFISLNGEILRVPGGALPVVVNPGDFLYWDIDVSYDPAGFEMFENGTSGDTYEIRTASVKVGQPSTYMPFVVDKLDTRIAKLVLALSPNLNWTINAYKNILAVGTAPVGEPSIASGFLASSYPAHYKVDSAGNIIIKGYFICNSSSNPQVIINLPNSLYPTRPVISVGSVFNTAGAFDRTVPVIVRQNFGGIYEVGFPLFNPINLANGEFISVDIIYQKS